jgi:hypothetical protein
MSKTTILPGINIQWPWSQLIASGIKTVETRKYPIPEKYIDRPLALIETPGPRGKKEAGIEKARIIGVITFSESFEYKTVKQWRDDYERHCVPTNDPQFTYTKGTPKWGWEVASVIQFTRPIKAPTKKGIVFATSCSVPL